LPLNEGEAPGMLLQDLRLLRLLTDQLLSQDSSQLLGSLCLPKDLHSDHVLAFMQTYYIILGCREAPCTASD
jgi:hypothetical protein